MALFAISMGLDRLILNPRTLNLSTSILVLAYWGGISGAYLGIRWRRQRGLAASLLLAVVASTVVTFANALVIGLAMAEYLRRMDYFEWREDWLLYFGLVGFTTLLGIFVSLFLTWLVVEVFGPFG